MKCYCLFPLFCESDSTNRINHTSNSKLFILLDQDKFEKNQSTDFEKKVF